MQQTSLRVFLIATVACLCAAKPLAVLADTQCDSILRSGVRDTISLSNTHDLRSDVASWLQSDNFVNYAKSLGGGLSVGVPIHGVPVKFGGNFDSASYQELKNSLQSGNTSHFSDISAQTVLQQIASPTIVGAWSKCVAKEGVPSLIDTQVEEQAPDTVIIHVRYTPPSLSLPAPEVARPATLVGVKTCGTPLDYKIGDHVDPSGRTAVCTRNLNEPLIFILETTEGIGRATLPAHGSVETDDLPCQKGDLDCLKHLKTQWIAEVPQAPLPPGFVVLRPEQWKDVQKMGDVRVRLWRIQARWTLMAFKDHLKDGNPAINACWDKWKATDEMVIAKESIMALTSGAVDTLAASTSFPESDEFPIWTHVGQRVDAGTAPTDLLECQ